jgi:hypothetical protein
MQMPLNRLTLHIIGSVLCVTIGCAGGASRENSYRVRVDKGVRCSLSPEQVVAIVGETDIAWLRCTTADELWYSTSEYGRDRRVVWEVQMERGGRIIEDATGMIIGAGGEDSVVRGGPAKGPELPQE